jgi:photosystem II stability/assembly factor-like uncharacterized protein
MRALLALALTITAAAQSIHLQNSHTQESFRGVSAVSREVAWASGTHGTYLRTTNAGRTWTSAQVPEATALDFRAVVAFSADEAFLMSAGPGDQSRIYHTSDAGLHWQLQFTNSNPKGFFDSMAFWDATHGVALGDPVPDQSGKLKFELIETEDGQSWHPIPTDQLPEAIEGEGAFAASNTCLALIKSVILSADMRTAEPSACRSRRTPCPSIVPAAWPGVFAPTLSWSRATADDSKAYPAHDPNLWFATGGKAARVFHSADSGKTWEVNDTPILHGPDSAGIFSIAFRSWQDGIIAGGDYKRPTFNGPNLAFTHDGGKTWEVAPMQPQVFYSAAAYDIQSGAEARHLRGRHAMAEYKQKKMDPVPDLPLRIYIVAQQLILDVRSPTHPRHLVVKKKPDASFNAIAPIPEGGAFAAGSKGLVALIR